VPIGAPAAPRATPCRRTDPVADQAHEAVGDLVRARLAAVRILRQARSIRGHRFLDERERRLFAASERVRRAVAG
jgi:hypothetical protein